MSPLRVPTCGTSMVASPMSLAAGQVGSVKADCANCAEEQPTRLPALLIEEESETPVGRSTTAFLSAPCSLPAVEAGAVILVVNALAPEACGGEAEKETAGLNPSWSQFVAVNGTLGVAVLPPTECSVEVVVPAAQVAGFVRKPDLLTVSVSWRRCSGMPWTEVGTSAMTSMP